MNDLLYEEALEAIRAIYDDQEAPLETRLENLNSLIDGIEVLLDALEESVKHA